MSYVYCFSFTCSKHIVLINCCKTQGQLFYHFAKTMAERNGQDLVILGYEKFNKHRKNDNYVHHSQMCVCRVLNHLLIVLSKKRA